MAEVDQSRRRWLKSLVPRALEVVAVEVEERLPDHIRPPGAIKEVGFLASCSRCDECVKACPHHAIYTLTAGAGVAAGTPVMSPGERACHECEGFPCAAACPDGALVVPEEPVWSFGSARLLTEHCFTFKGPECGACGGLCPEGAKALTFTNNRPAIDESICVGCGLCIEACPTAPKAIAFVRRR